MRKLNAVLCGINDYNYPVPPLRGCVADVELWESYLKNQGDQYDVSITKLLNEQATKSEILQSIAGAMADASENDVVFIYFSGHGTRETADPVFSDVEQDDGLEAFLNYDGIVFNGRLFEYNLLSDKELHYAMHSGPETGAHLVFVVDTCHSGGITRNLVMTGDGEDALVRRHEATERLGIMAPMRRWEQFTFGEVISREEVERLGWFNVVPQRPHITMSACQNDESAYESDGQGVFTRNIIKVLNNSRGAVTYRGLQAKVRQYIRNQFNQTPEVYSTRHNTEDLLRSFIDRTGEKGKFFILCFHKKDRGWAIDLGSAQGVRLNSGPVRIKVGDQTIEAGIAEIKSDYTLLTIPDEVLAKMEESEQYEAELENYLSGSVCFTIDPSLDTTTANLLRARVEESLAEGRLPFSLTETGSEASYEIASGNGCLSIRHSAGHRYPVFTVKEDELAFDRLMDAMRHIAKWEFVRTYENPDADLSSGFPVDVRFELRSSDGQRKPVEYSRETVNLDFQEGATLRISVENKSETKYYCSLLYLSNTFQVLGSLLDNKVTGLNKEETALVFNGQELPLILENHVREFNMPESVSYLKLIANTEEFRVESLEMDELPAPKRSCTDQGDDAGGHRGLGVPRKEKVEPIPWFTRTIALKISNPEYTEVN